MGRLITQSPSSQSPFPNPYLNHSIKFARLLMLKQLEQLTISADGRYATTEELMFLRDYLATIDLRLSTYQKIRDAEIEIVDRLQDKMREMKPEIFQTNSGDRSAKCRRDCQIVLRSASAALLIDDLDRLKENILLWQRTIIKAFQLNSLTEVTYKLMPSIIQEFVTPKEFSLIEPILQLNQTVLTY